MKNYSLKKKKFMSFFLTLLTLISIILLHNFIGGYNYETDVACINSEVWKSDYVDNIVFKYENEKQEIIMYQTEDKTFWTGLVYKRTVNGITRYKFKHTSTTVPYNNITNEIKELGCFRYIAVHNDKDIEKYDFVKYEPEMFEIEFKTSDGITNKGILYITDTSK